MSIKTTQHVTRSWAIERIKKINQFIDEFDYFSLSMNAFEPDQSVEYFVDSFSGISSNVNKWTNETLEEILDMPFFRESMFYNYIVKSE